MEIDLPRSNKRGIEDKKMMMDFCTVHKTYGYIYLKESPQSEPSGIAPKT